MAINKIYAVFGLGRYGSSIARELVRNGAEVLAVDKNEDIVNAIIEDIPFAKCADITEKGVLEELGVENVDVAIVAMAGSLESSVMATLLLKESGIKTVIAKCADEMQGKILTRVGADKVVVPEHESGIRLAKNLLSSGFVDVVELSRDVSLVELDVKEEWVGHSLSELGLRSKYSVNVVAVVKGDDVNVNIDPTAPLEKSSSLVVIANTESLTKLK